MAKSAAKKMDDYRERMRRQGLRQVQIWVPDIRTPGFAEELQRQSRLVSSDTSEDDVFAFMDAVTDWDDIH